MPQPRRRGDRRAVPVHPLPVRRMEVGNTGARSWRYNNYWHGLEQSRAEAKKANADAQAAREAVDAAKQARAAQIREKRPGGTRCLDLLRLQIY